MSVIDTTVTWHNACKTADIPANGGGTVLLNGIQIAVFNFDRRNEWYATDNLCPHKMQMVLSRGMIGTQGEEPKVACPFHKKTFSLKSGDCLSGDDYKIKTYAIKVEGDCVYVGL